MRIRLAIVFCSLAAICTAGLVYLPSSESSVAKPMVPEQQAPEFNIDMVMKHPKGYHLKSVTYEDNGKPTDPKEMAEKVAQFKERLEKVKEKISKM